MRHGTGANQFDLSDIHGMRIDKLDGVLDVAAEVLLEYGPDPGDTRIERLARWVMLNMGGVPEVRSGMTRLARYLALEYGSEARLVAAEILRATERAEG